jgi:hypothetical protein
MDQESRQVIRPGTAGQAYCCVLMGIWAPSGGEICDTSSFALGKDMVDQQRIVVEVPQLQLV